MIGQSLAHYEILSLLGKGGMGEVYRAQDTKLGREVALKILPLEFGEDSERLARFRREARTLASLQHPNIATIYGLEEAADRVFLTMELAEGEDLAARIERGPLPWEDAVQIARCVAEGLEAAHAKGIVHRDLKPSNVKLTNDGRVKILDFGLARAYTGEAVDEGDISSSPTITAAMTQAGTILGTAAYMSPEQARGKPIDHRADIWAFGVLLWEMLGGRRLFEGETTNDVLANVLKDRIDLEDVPAGTPAAVRRVLRRCLTRDPQRRLHAIADARIELEHVDEAEVDWATTRPTPAPTPTLLPWLLSGVLLMACIALAWRPWRSPVKQAATDMAVALTLPEDTELALIDWSALAVSRDGRDLALTARVDGRTAVVARSIDQRKVRRLSGSGSSYNVFFSPDGRWVGYYSDNRIMKVSVDGGAEVEITETAHPRGASWGDDGYIYYSPEYSAGIYRVHDSGAHAPEMLTEPDPERSERTHRWPDFLPGAVGVIFTVGVASSPGDYEDAEIAVYDSRNREMRYLGVKGAIARYAPTGHLLVMRNGVLHAVRFDLDSLSIVGAPLPVFDGIRGDPASGMYYFAVDAATNLYYVAARPGGPQRRLVWIDREGKAGHLALAPGRYRYPRIHPDGDRVVLVMGEGHGNNDDIYRLDLDDLNLTRLTFDRTSILPMWTPEGDGLVYANLAGSVQVRSLDAAAATRNVPGLVGIQLPTSIGADGRSILTTRLGAPTLGDIWVLDIADSARSSPVLTSPAAEWGAVFSPDQKWIAYCSDETGREEIFVQPYPPTGAKWQVSSDGGRAPRFSKDGREIFFVLGDRFYRAAFQSEPQPRIQRPELLFEYRMDSSGVPLANYDVSADGRRFLIVESDASAGVRQVEIVLGWASMLREQVP